MRVRGTVVSTTMRAATKLRAKRDGNVGDDGDDGGHNDDKDEHRGGGDDDSYGTTATRTSTKPVMSMLVCGTLCRVDLLGFCHGFVTRS